MLNNIARASLLCLFIFNLSSAKTPDWAKDAVWYQIFPERFYNGDPANDPTAESLHGTWPWEDQSYWDITPWTSDWYTFQPWEIENGHPYNYQFQLRRYGGDIQGIINKLDYLKDLGVTAIYLNPVFDSPSSHKYGAASYHHVDRHFGPDPEGDADIMNSEDPLDPTTWKWTSADKLFLDLVHEIHNRDMYIIIDGVFNHAGLTFWAFQDVIKNREESPFYSLYNIEGSNLPDKSHLNDFQDLPDYYKTESDEPLRYTGYVADLPAFRQDENGPVEPIRAHFQHVVQRWMDPNNDGDPTDGIDGWRLDVAERVQMGFWDLFGDWVRDINPDAYITGEVWWEDWWNNKQFNAAPWFEGNRFDAVMNYRFGDAMYKFFNDKNQAISPSELDELLGQIRTDYPLENTYVLQNLLDSHDTERISSGVVNPDRWIDHGANMPYNKEFDIRKPNEQERQVQQTMVAFQFTYIGAPFIYYGTEAGMWGSDDPDCRKPMVWPEFTYDDETTHPCDYDPECDYSRPLDKVIFDKDLHNFYSSMGALRQSSKVLRRGDYRTVFVDDKNGLFAFEREHGDEKVLAVFNQSTNPAKLNKKIFPGKKSAWKQLMSNSSGRGIDGKSFIIYTAK